MRKLLILTVFMAIWFNCNVYAVTESDCVITTPEMERHYNELEKRKQNYDFILYNPKNIARTDAIVNGSNISGECVIYQGRSYIKTLSLVKFIKGYNMSLGSSGITINTDLLKSQEMQTDHISLFNDDGAKEIGLTMVYHPQPPIIRFICERNGSYNKLITEEEFMNNGYHILVIDNSLHIPLDILNKFNIVNVKWENGMAVVNS